MSLFIRCPQCGPRPLVEFLFGEVKQPPSTLTSTQAREVDRSFMHDNLEGPSTEQWFHAQGCRRWLLVVRDTRTDQILSCE